MIFHHEKDVRCLVHVCNNHMKYYSDQIWTYAVKTTTQCCFISHVQLWYWNKSEVIDWNCWLFFWLYSSMHSLTFLHELWVGNIFVCATGPDGFMARNPHWLGMNTDQHCIDSLTHVFMQVKNWPLSLNPKFVLTEQLKWRNLNHVNTWDRALNSSLLRQNKYLKHTDWLLKTLHTQKRVPEIMPNKTGHAFPTWLAW